MFTGNLFQLINETKLQKAGNRMLRYVIVRTIWIFIVLFTFLSLLFITTKLVPEYPPTLDDQKDAYYQQQVIDGYMTVTVIDNPKQVAEIKANLGEYHNQCKNKCYYRDLGDKIWLYEKVPVIQQYFTWLKAVVTEWNWGNTTRVAPVGVPVFEVIGSRVKDTMLLNFLSLLVFMPVGFALGILAALKKNKLTDNIISLGVMVFISVPSFITMLLFLLLFGYTLGWLPTQYPANDITGFIRVKALILPVLGLSLGSIAGLTRLTRAELTEVLTSDFLLLARTKGLTRKQAVIRHAMRNSMVPLVPSIIFSFVSLLSGSVVIEQIYSISGMGRLYIDALRVQNFDYNMLMALSAVYTSISLVAVLVVDLTYGIVDPRIRMGAKR